MVALAELGPRDLSPGRESEIWEAIRAQGAYKGSLPGRIAVRAVEGAAARIWVDQPRLQAAEHHLGSNALFDVPSLLADHREALTAAQAVAVPIEMADTDPTAFLERMNRGERLMLAFAVPLKAGIVLHWRLYRMEGRVIWEMDPADGADTPLTENQLQTRLSTYIGTAVGIGPQLRPPAR